MLKVEVGLGSGSEVSFRCSDMNQLHKVSAGKLVEFSVVGGTRGEKARKYIAKVSRNESVVSFHLKEQDVGDLEAHCVIDGVFSLINV
ncbi:hypothetical protein JQC92_15120 [Shewanella sp. 202IG2-18]|uniref:hypothetical protein n=1 Tax=Parashewanella hymeniacidonis TaxID=2807618 RepID=UPI00195F5FD4|nr:hypothetical protein [Parashewanella hymeniacidonis]MBM7073345.1 hypothetical protein [Parashewanella hymeniacidonis]